MRILLIFIVLATSVLGQEILLDRAFKVSKGKILKLKVENLFSTLPGSGYAPIRVTTQNDSAEDFTWTLKFSSSLGWYYGNSGSIDFKSSFQCPSPSGKKNVIDLVIPLAVFDQAKSYSGNNVRLSLEAHNGQGISARGSMEAEISTSLPSILMSEKLHTQNSSRLNRKKNLKYSDDAPFGGSFAPERLPTDWRSYHGYEQILLTDGDWRQISPGAQTAIKTWVRMGGDLLVYHTSDHASSRAQIFSETEDSGLGVVRVKPIQNDLKLVPSETIADVRFGRGETSRHKALTESFTGGWDAQNRLGKKSFQAFFILLILILFAIIVGPINVFVFAKAGQRHKLFLTTPIISAITSVLLFMIIMIQDGIGGKGQRVALMEIGAGDDKNAYLFQEQFSRTGFMFSSSFEVEESAFLIPVPIAKSQWSRYDDLHNGPRINITATPSQEGQSFSGDWFQSRSEQGHYLATVRPHRGQLTLSGSATAPVLTSSLAFDLESLVYHDEQSNYWKAGSLKSSQSVTLEKISQEQYLEVTNTFQTKLAQLNQRKFLKLIGRKRSFTAISQTAPHIETHSSIDWEKSTSILTGKL